jgi:hypothetical protein
VGVEEGDILTCLNFSKRVMLVAGGIWKEKREKKIKKSYMV